MDSPKKTSPDASRGLRRSDYGVRAAKAEMRYVIGAHNYAMRTASRSVKSKSTRKKQESC